ncbi:MAG: hypothetical protein ACH346_06015 [Chthoniobacterales bacterium]
MDPLPSNEPSSAEFYPSRPPLNLPPKPVLASSLSTPIKPPSLSSASLEETEKPSQPVEQKSCSHRHRASLFLGALAIIAALLALGMQLWTYLEK